VELRLAKESTGAHSVKGAGGKAALPPAWTLHDFSLSQLKVETSPLTE